MFPSRRSPPALEGRVVPIGLPRLVPLARRVARIGPLGLAGLLALALPAAQAGPSTGGEVAAEGAAPAPSAPPTAPFTVLSPAPKAPLATPAPASGASSAAGRPAEAAEPPGSPLGSASAPAPAASAPVAAPTGPVAGPDPSAATAGLNAPPPVAPPRSPTFVPGVPAAAAAAPAGAADAPLAAPRTARRPPATPSPSIPGGSATAPAAPAVPLPPSPDVSMPPAAADLVRDARAAFGRRDRVRLAALRDQAIATRHPLAPWFDYWELTARLTEVSSPEVEAFYARWPGSYVEDRLRNDWLVELGHRRDWPTLAREYPRFRMNDDRQVNCYLLVIDHLAGRDVAVAARAAWRAQRDADEGCQLMAQTLLEAGVFTEADVWSRLRQAAEQGKSGVFNGPSVSKAAASLLPKATQQALGALWDDPGAWLARKRDARAASQRELVAIAFARLSARDAVAAAAQFAQRGAAVVGRDLAAWTWAVIGKQAAMSQRPESLDIDAHAWAAAVAEAAARHLPATSTPADWSDDLLGWQVRAALRYGSGDDRWKSVLRSIDAMSATERADPTWVYWHARARLALAADGPAGEADRAAAHVALSGIASPLSYYGLLAAEELSPLPPPLPPRPSAPTLAEREAIHATPGFRRALALAAIDLRDEARREWNFTLRGLDDRGLIAAARWACEVGDWQICTNTSERTRTEVDVAQRYVMPYAADITAAARAAGVDPALAFGLIRQETRFMGQMASAVGASGLMQLMPPTARWVARKAGLDFRPDQVTDPEINLRLGNLYLRRVLDSFGGSVPMAAAAYNAGPARPRRWRDGPVIEPAIWIENIPFHETRDYVKKVSTNYAVYTALITHQPAPLKPRLGPPIGPLSAQQSAAQADLP